MRCSMWIALITLLVPTVVVAQNTSDSGSANFSSLVDLKHPERSPQVVQPAQPVCPVSMTARQGVDGSVLATRDSASTRGPSQRIHLQVASRRKEPVLSAKIRVRGLSDRGRIAGTPDAPALPVDRVRTVTAAFTPDGASATADLVLSGFTSIATLDLVEIAYADGTTLRLAGDAFCRVQPDILLRVALH